jgi:3-oxocholest-4-en-26-oyl-CoA dehydrogenase alpha subunit
MHITYTPEQQQLQEELRAYFAQLMTPERREALAATTGEYGEGNVYREVVAQMGQDGWLTLGWPKEYGGQERSAMDQLIFTDEAAIAGAVPDDQFGSADNHAFRYGRAEGLLPAQDLSR